MADEWIKKMYIYAMEFYSTIKKNEVLLFAYKWMELKNFMLNEVNHAKKNPKVTCFPSYVDARPIS
jgi:hypothetical protein